MAILKVGAKFFSAVCDAEVMLLHCSGPEADLRCGGSPMIAAAAAEKAPIDPNLAGGLLVGKRYVDSADQIEVLCVKQGKGTLTFNGEALRPKQPKPLPASD
jgi:hypothetical protein